MNHKVTLPELTTLLAERTGASKRQSEAFLKSLFSAISDALVSGDNVKIKELGTFKLTEIDSRKSVDVNTGLDIEIAGHNRISFIAAKSLAERVNAPFELFETVELSDAVTDDMLEKIDTLPADAAIEENGKDVTPSAAPAEEKGHAPEVGNAPAETIPVRGEEAASGEAASGEAGGGILPVHVSTGAGAVPSSENAGGGILPEATGAGEEPSSEKGDSRKDTIVFEEAAWQPTAREEAAAAEAETTLYDLERDTEGTADGSSTEGAGQPAGMQESTEAPLPVEAGEARKEPFHLTPPSSRSRQRAAATHDTAADAATAGTVAPRPEVAPEESRDIPLPESAVTENKGTANGGASSPDRENDSVARKEADDRSEESRAKTPAETPAETSAGTPDKTPAGTQAAPAKHGKGVFGRGFVMGMLTCLLLGAVAIAVWYHYGHPSQTAQPAPAPVDSAQIIAKAQAAAAPRDTTAATPTDSLKSEKITAEPDNAVKIEEKKVEEKPTADTKPSDQPVYDVISKSRYLTTMAGAHYGNYNLWPYIYEANKGLGHPDRIRPGTKIKIPDLAKLGIDPKNPADIAKAKRKGVEIYNRYNTPSKKPKR